MRRLPVRAALAAVVLAAAAGVGHPQPAPGPPQFSTRTDVVLVDVRVLDADGAPVRDLSPGEFAVRVDGRPRTVVSAELVDVGGLSGAGAQDVTIAPPEDAGYSSNQATGRLSALFVFDLASFRPGEERPAVVAALGLFDDLPAATRVGVATIPPPGPLAWFPPDRAEVRGMMAGVIGTKMESAGILSLGLAESLRAARGDRSAFQQIVQRECLAQAAPPTGAAGAAALASRTQCDQPGYEPDCPCAVQSRLKAEVGAVSNAIRRDADDRARALLRLFDRLRALAGPKLVVLVSQGILLDGLPIDAPVLAAAAGLADARVHVISVEGSTYDASSRERPTERLEVRSLARQGLDQLADVLGARVTHAMGQVGPQLERVMAENAVSWRVAVSAVPADLDGKPHRLEVKVQRAGAAVLARSHFIRDAPATPADATPDVRLRRAIESAVPMTELPMRLTHSARGGEGGAVQLEIAGDVLVAGDGSGTRAQFVVADASGRVVANGARALDPGEADARGRIPFAAAASVVPGRYLVKVAAVSSDGRLGSVDRLVDLSALGADAGGGVATPGATASGTATGTRAALLQLPPLVPAFHRQAVLRGDPLRLALAQLAERPAASAPGVTGALKAAEGGSFPAPDGGDVPSGDPPDPALAAMLRGLGLLEADRTNDALTQFKAALDDSPDLSAALVYAGACYAATGHDREAAGAWQTALIDDPTARPIYTLLIDALLRLGDHARARDVLARASARWPSDLELARRQVIALAAAGDRDQARARLDELVAIAPDDGAAACLGFQLDAPVPARAAAPVPERLRTLARACAAASSEPLAPVAAAWLRSVGDAPK
jgi:tetratricopeptide (TPR) repeat protein